MLLIIFLNLNVWKELNPQTLMSRECPLDLKEAISSVCFAAPRCADLPELLQVQMMFAGKYGKEFIAAATELMPECGVNRQVTLVILYAIAKPERGTVTCFLVSDLSLSFFWSLTVDRVAVYSSSCS